MRMSAVPRLLAAAGNRNAFLTTIAVPLLVVPSPFLVFVKFHDYGLLHTEMLLSYSIIGMVGLALGGALVVTPRVIQLVIVASLLTVFADFQFDFQSLFKSFEYAAGELRIHPRAAFLGLVICVFAGCLAALWVIRRHAMTIVAVTFAVINAAIFLFGVGGGGGSGVMIPTHATTQGDLDKSLPPIVHLILDEHIGVEGIPNEIAGGRELRALLKQVYVDEDFRLYGRAYSMYYNTYNAISNIVNFSADDVDGAYIEGISRPFRLISNAYFRYLAERGYRIRVYQADYIDYCAGQEDIIDACVTYASTSAGDFENLPLPASSKLRLLWSMFLERSFVYVTLRKFYMRFVFTPAASRGIALPTWSWERARVGPLPTITVLEKLVRDIRTGARGNVFFAHLLSPHFPYILERDCRVNPDVGKWEYNQDPSLPWPQTNSPKSWRQSFKGYVNQIFCLHRQLGTVLRALRETGAFGDATVILHGDHGSRIVKFRPTYDNLDRLDRDDFIDGFSTFFAVHAPGLAPGYDSTLIPLQEIFPTLWGVPPLRLGKPVLYLRDRRRGPLVARSAVTALDGMRGNAP